MWRAKEQQYSYTALHNLSYAYTKSVYQTVLCCVAKQFLCQSLMNLFELFCEITMSDVKKQNMCIKFCFNLDKMAAETLKMLWRFGEDS